MRRVTTRVLPDPAPARMHSGAASLSTARRWAGFRPSSRCSYTHRTLKRGCDSPVDGGWPALFPGKQMAPSNPPAFAFQLLGAISSDVVLRSVASLRDGRPSDRRLSFGL